jgi:hypothetical protein
MTETTMNTLQFFDDIPRVVAIRAHAGTSFDAESRGDAEMHEYASALATDFEILSKYALTDEKRAILDAEFARYRQGYKARALAYFITRGRYWSPMISGPSNYPARRMAKRHAVWRKRLDELCEFRKRALESIRKTLNPEWRPIMAGDDNALDRLTTKIADREKRVAVMKAANAAIRKNVKQGREAQIAAILAVDPMFTKESAAELLAPDDMGRVGFPPFLLQNNGAELRRLRARLADLQRDKATPETILEGDNAVRLEDCPSDNRVRLFFPGKPDSAIRTRLKSNGFRWTPSLGCWQAYRNPRSLALAKQFVSPPEPPENHHVSLSTDFATSIHD